MYVGVVRAPLGVITIKSLYSTVRAHNDVRALQVRMYYKSMQNV